MREKTIYEKIAEKYNTTPEEVRREMQIHLLLTILCENKPGYARKQKYTRLTKPEKPRKTKKCEVMQQ